MTKLNYSIYLFFLLLFSITLLGCNLSNTYDDPPLNELCSNIDRDVPFSEIFNGNMVIAASYSKNGQSSAELISDLIYNIVLNGIDFTGLLDYTISFDKTTGHYELSNDKASIGFTLYFDKDFGDFAKGDFIPYNIFNYKTFVTNVKVDVTSGLKLKASYDEGNLYGIVDGDVNINSSLDVNLKIDTSAIAIKINSENNYPGSHEINKDDNLNLKISTTNIALDKYKQQLDEGGVGMDLSGTVYDSVYFGISQIFTDATISIRRNNDNNSWFVEGTYNSKITKDDIDLYQDGLVSSSQNNTTNYYCDANDAEKIGTANHKLDLSGGTFNFTDGGSFNYDLESY